MSGTFGTLEREFEATRGRGLETVEGGDYNRFVTQVTECRFQRMEDTLTFDFLVKDAGLDGSDVPVLEIGEVKVCFCDVANGGASLV